MNGLTRQRISGLFLALVFLLTMVGGPILYVGEVIEDEDAFVAVADRVVASEAAEQAISESIANVMFETVAADEQLAEVLPDSVKTFTVPLTRIAVDQFSDLAITALQTEKAADLRNSALREVHRQVTSGDDEVVIDLRAVLVSTAREIGGVTIGSGVAKVVSGSDTGRYVLAESGTPKSEMVQALTLVPTIGGMLAILSLIALVVAIALARDRPQALMRGGLVLAAASAVTSVLVALLLDTFLGDLRGGSAIGTAIADVVAADFAQQQRGSIVVGLLLALIGLLLGERPAAVFLRALPGKLWHRRPGIGVELQGLAARNPSLTRSSIWLTGALTLDFWPSPTKRVLVTVIGLTAVLHIGAWLLIGTTKAAQGLRRQIGLEFNDSTYAASETSTRNLRLNLGILSLILFLLWPGWSKVVFEQAFVLVGLVQVGVEAPALRRIARARRADDQLRIATSDSVTASRWRYYLASGFAVLAIALGVQATAGSHERLEASKECNGHVELCDRRIDEVVFAGSHNSMSSTDLGWDLAMQTGDMVNQLDFGVRALLIDALYWDTPGDPDILEGASNAAIEAALSDEEPRPGTWLCHVFCALGATELTSGLTEIALWMDTHPREVLLIIVQDEVTEQDLEAAFVGSGLRDLAYIHEPGTSYPTLGELIEADTRILVYGENLGEPGSWFQNAWDTTFRETPFTFALRSEFSCDANRGSEGNDLFLINHWLTTGIPVQAAAIPANSRSALLERVNECLQDRGRLPTILAVDFVETGDLIEVVDELNLVGPGG